MTRDDDFIGRLEGYLDEYEGMTPLPEGIRDAVRAELPRKKQIGPFSGLMRTVTMVTPTRFAITAAAAVVVTVVGINLLPAFGLGGDPSTSPSPSPSPSPQPSSATPVSAYPPGDPWIAIGSHSVTVDGVPLSFDMPNGDWQGMGPFYIAKDTYGPQGAEAIILWTTLPDSLPPAGVGGPILQGSYILCRDLLGTSPGSSSLADIAAAMSTVVGTDLVSGPSDVTVGGRAAKRVSFFATYNVMNNGSVCSPGLFMSWDDPTGGAMWGSSLFPGDTFRVWIVDVDGKRLLIEAATHWNADVSIEEEIQQIVDSIRFE